MGKLSKYRNMLINQIRNKPSTVYHISKDSEKRVKLISERNFKNGGVCQGGTNIKKKDLGSVFFFKDLGHWTNQPM